MKKILPILLILFLLPINAEAVDIAVSPVSGTTRVEKTFTYQITVTNNMRIPDDFILTVFGRHLEWADLQSYYFYLEPYESREISLNFYPKEEGNYNYEVQASSIRNPRNRDSLILDLKVNPLIDPDITDFSVDVIGDELKVDLTATSKKTRDIEIDFGITDSNENRVKVLSITRSVTGEREISESISLKDMPAGSYSIKVSLVGTDVIRTANFYIPTVHHVVTTKKTVSNPLVQEVTITVSNQGNTMDNYNIEENLPAGQYVTLIDSPSSQYLQEDEMVYQWSLTGDYGFSDHRSSGTWHRKGWQTEHTQEIHEEEGFACDCFGGQGFAHQEHKERSGEGQGFALREGLTRVRGPETDSQGERVRNRIDLETGGHKAKERDLPDIQNSPVNRGAA